MATQQCHYWYYQAVTKVEQIVEEIGRNPKGVRFADLAKVCADYFGAPRQQGTSHHVYKTPWPGDPRVNIQNDHGKAKAYQVKQVLAAIDKLQAQSEAEEETP